MNAVRHVFLAVPFGPRCSLGGMLASLALPAALLAGATALAAPTEGTGGQTVTSRSLSQPAPAARVSNPPRQRSVAAPAPSKPLWSELTPAQQRALQPLSPHWDRLSEYRKRKWIVISRHFSRLPPVEQAKLHNRMSDWASLSQHQRTQARKVFKEAKNLSPEQRAASWRAYQALSAEERRQLAAKARSAPIGATAPKPAATRKLAKVPGPRYTSLQSTQGNGGHREVVQPLTLLPKPGPSSSGSYHSPDEESDNAE